MSGKKYFSNAYGLQNLIILQQMACTYHTKAAVETTFRVDTCFN